MKLFDGVKPHDVKLHLKIEGHGLTIETKPEYFFERISIVGGENLILSGDDFYQYFQLSSLKFSGFTKREFQNLGRLPDGLYRFYLEVWDYDRNFKISNSAMAQVFLVQNDPPDLLMPADKDHLGKIPNTPILFNWFPRHTGSPNSAFTPSNALLFQCFFNIKLSN